MTSHKMKRRSVIACFAAVFILVFGAVIAVRTVLAYRNTGGSSRPATGSSQLVSLHLLAEISTGSPVTSMSFSPDGKLLALSFAGRAVQLRDPKTGRVLASLKLGQDDEGSFAFSPDGKFLAVGVMLANGQTSMVDFLNVDTRRLAFALPIGVSNISSLAFSPDGNVLAVAGGTFLVLLNLSTHSSIYVPDSAPNNDIDNAFADPQADYVTFSADGKWLALIGDLGQARLWNINTNRFVKDAYMSAAGRGIPRSETPSATVDAVAFGPDAETVAIGGCIGGALPNGSSFEGAAAWLWHTSAGKITSLINGPIDPSDNDCIGFVAFDRQYNFLATDGNPGKILQWNATTGEAIDAFDSPVSGSTNGLAFSPNGRIMAVAQWIGGTTNGTETVQLWNVYAP